MTTLTLAEGRIRQFLALTKPRVVTLIVFCAVIGMFLAVPGLPPPGAVFFATIGIALVAGAAAAGHRPVEQKVAPAVARTRRPPPPHRRLSPAPTIVVARPLRRPGRLR